ncbi:MAG: hypothetical protein GXO30_08110, partial [Epsilonproteobacteria bacterium]|nr:hypothetical protein [Campylobacterota bacterium]
KTKKRTKKIVKKVIKKEPKRVKTNTNHKIQIIKASTFYLKRDSSIYDSIDGKKIDKWEQDTTFTSNQRTNSYI